MFEIISGIIFWGLLIYFIFFRIRKDEDMFDKIPATKYYSKINQWCFYTCIASVIVGFFITLLMIWEVFENDRVVEKAWVSLALFFGTALIIALLNNSFSLRVMKKNVAQEVE